VTIWVFVVVAHPFHPLPGSRLAVLFVNLRGAGAVFVCAGLDGEQVTLRESWTDRGHFPGRLRRRCAAGDVGAGKDLMIADLADHVTRWLRR
jgi:hypothetical protein